jgi:hypothetical protein
METKNNILKIDFGSGYNPKLGFSSCDFTTNPMLCFQFIDNKIIDKNGNELLKNSVDEFFCKNVIHHIKNLDNLFKMFRYYLKYDGILTIIECNENHFTENVILDTIWYRYINPRYDIWISKLYRNYLNIANRNGFKVKYSNKINEKEKYILK